jgi:CRP-like cAMP-binding protein
MKIIPDLKRFINFNHIDDDSIRSAAGYFYHRKYKKNEYICYEGEESNVFFVVISGRVSIRRKKLVDKYIQII